MKMKRSLQKKRQAAAKQQKRSKKQKKRQPPEAGSRPVLSIPSARMFAAKILRQMPKVRMETKARGLMKTMLMDVYAHMAKEMESLMQNKESPTLDPAEGWDTCGILGRSTSPHFRASGREGIGPRGAEVPSDLPPSTRTSREEKISHRGKNGSRGDFPKEKAPSFVL
uniref:Uncharacterized protein n=1 Tax=Sphaerodactylus townsendi TaxID=933632 RepID=A0ACB8FFD4_9SAUR